MHCTAVKGVHGAGRHSHPLPTVEYTLSALAPENQFLRLSASVHPSLLSSSSSANTFEAIMFLIEMEPVTQAASRVVNRCCARTCTNTDRCTREAQRRTVFAWQEEHELADCVEHVEWVEALLEAP